jgi:hypothetical protein
MTEAAAAAGRTKAASPAARISYQSITRIGEQIARDLPVPQSVPDRLAELLRELEARER